MQLAQQSHEFALDIADRRAQRRQTLIIAEDQRAQRLTVNRAVSGDNLLAELGDDPPMRVAARLIHRMNMFVRIEVRRPPALDQPPAKQRLPRRNRSGNAKHDGHFAASCRRFLWMVPYVNHESRT